MKKQTKKENTKFDRFYNLVVGNIDKVLYRETYGDAVAELLLCLDLIALAPLQPLYFSLVFIKKIKDKKAENSSNKNYEKELDNNSEQIEELEDLLEELKEDVSLNTNQKKYSYNPTKNDDYKILEEKYNKVYNEEKKLTKTK